MGAITAAASLCHSSNYGAEEREQDEAAVSPAREGERRRGERSRERGGRKEKQGERQAGTAFKPS